VTSPVTITPVSGIPEVHVGDNLTALIEAGLRHSGVQLADGDIVVVSSKIASKALGLVSDDPDKDRVVAAETAHVVAERALADRVTRVVRAHAGPVLAAAGVDGSNTGPRGGWLLLPRDPDAVCRRLHAELTTRLGVRLAVLLTDTAGRPWRIGQTDFALGSHGLTVVDDLRGGHDADGRSLEVTVRAVADEIAAAADLVKGKATGLPVAVVRGLSDLVRPDQVLDGARDLVRTGPGDWFALGTVEAVRAALGVEPGTPESLAVGVPPPVGSTRREALRRAVGLALAGVPTGRADVVADSLTLGADDPFQLGRLTARIEAALWTERLVAEPAVPSADGCSVEVTVRDRRDD
jgi:coenzyme F420-0:L-glutamate ligase/coenzyme F420-1:gamma-L-glutamate ligase